MHVSKHRITFFIKLATHISNTIEHHPTSTIHLPIKTVFPNPKSTPVSAPTHIELPSHSSPKLKLHSSLQHPCTLIGTRCRDDLLVRADHHYSPRKAHLWHSIAWKRIQPVCFIENGSRRYMIAYPSVDVLDIFVAVVAFAPEIFTVSLY